jgi:starch phosphorylase
VFLEDYDLSVAQELTQGVDVWINTPRPPWEACGTSGMKVLVNGGLNLSVRDGWWDEAFAPDLGWTIDGSGEHDADDAERLGVVLETEVIPEFFERDAAGLPRAWLARIRRSMAELTPRYSSTRMLRDYVETAYLPAARAVRRRLANSAQMARSLAAWQDRIQRGWPTLRIGTPEMRSDQDTFVYTVPVCLGTLAADDVLIEVYADPISADACRYALSCGASGPDGTHLYSGTVPASRPAPHYTVRAMPRHPDATAPAELPMILWQK